MTSHSRAPHLADALAVAQWAERIGARSEFPRLVRRLIRQTNDQVVVLEIRADEGTDYKGYDGIVEATKATPFVPEGMSVWEFGAGADPKGKADDDYKTRTETPLGVDKSTTTFVFATPRRWAGKTDWAKGKRDENEWADVKAFDADDVDTAFESAPAAHFWFSELVGLPVDGIRMIEGWWDAFSQTSQPHLTPELVLAGRADQAAALLRLLEEETRLTTISATSPDDALAFVAATLLSTVEPSRSDLLARTLIVHEANALRRLDATTDLLVLLPFDEELRREARLIRSHHVVLLAPENVPADISLPGVDREAFSAALRKDGLKEDDATRFAAAAHRSLVAFQAETTPSAARRDWASAFGSKIARRAWLAGGWQEARSGDTDVLASLIGTSYEDARAELASFATGEDPIFTTVGGTWGLISAVEAWRFGYAQLTGPDLEALESVIQTILGAVDPSLELAVDERWRASIYGKSRVHSSDLRKGLATTLAVFGAFGGAVRIGAIGMASDWTAGVIAQLLKRANEDESGDLWASLTDVLPLLAEAAPEVFLRAVQKGTEEHSEPILRRLFLDSSGDAFTVSSPHPGLLWALESLAWSPEHAGLAIQLLARLAEIDPGGRLSNRPMKSLVDIFRPWVPQTSLSVERRLAVLDALRRTHPDVAWELMLASLPEHFGVGNFTHAPQFRDWKPADEDRKITWDERWEFEAAVAQRLFEDVGSQPDRWLQLAEHFDRLPHAEWATAIDRLGELAPSEDLDSSDRERLWEVLDQLVRRHRSFASADWALPRVQLDRLAEVVDAFRPQDPVRSSTWLFDSDLPDMGDERGEFEYHEQERKARGARSRAVAAILEQQSLEGLLRLADAAEQPWLVGMAAADYASAELDDRIVALIDADERRHSNFATGYATWRYRPEGLSWVKSMLPALAERPLAQARLLQVVDELPEAWQVTVDLGPEVQQAYWNEFSPLGRGDFQLVNESARHLLDFGRPVTALDLLALYARRDDRRVSADLALEALEAFVTLPADDQEQSRVATHDLQSVLDYLRQAEVDEDRLGTLEWQLLPALGFAARSPILERRLARDPGFFVEILSLIYRARDDEDPPDLPENVAANAYRLLGEWAIVPGSTTEMGEINADELNAWVDQARELAREAGRAEIGDQEIGKILANAGGDDDGTWPTHPVRDVLERLRSSDVTQGFQIEVFNNRGTTSRGLTAGGEQERVLVEKYDALAERIRDGWPTTASVLSSLARGYEREAARWDEDAERFRQDLDR